jgi:glycosyltransferase involved in cell wall biosynthesis
MTMYEDYTVGVVVPAYDEEGFVGEVIDTMPDFVDRIYAVDDCSTDGTWQEIRESAERVNERADEPESTDDGSGSALDGSGSVDGGPGSVADGNRRSTDRDETHRSTAAAHSEPSPGTEPMPDYESQRVVPIRHEENRGVGAAIKTGYRRAYEDGIDVVAVMAGDGQMDPDLLSAILDPVVTGRADYSKGNRLLSEDYSEGMSGWRLFGNSLLTLLTKVSSGYWKMMDPQNGYTAISRRALDRIDLDAVFDDYGFANAMLVHCNVANLRVADVPTPAVYGDEESHIEYSTFVPQLSALLARGFGWRLQRKYLLRDFHPLAFLYGLGVLGTLGGIYATLRGRLSGGGDETVERAANEIEDGPLASADGGVPAGADADARQEQEYEYDGNGTMVETDTKVVEAGRSTGNGPLTVLVGLVTTVLAMSFDLAENEHLHVRVDPSEVEAATDSEEGSR